MCSNWSEALSQGRLDLVSKYLEKTVSLVNEIILVDNLELTPIEIALKHGYKTIARKIIASPQFDLNHKGHNPLRLSIQLGYLDIAQELLEAGANPNYYQKQLSSPLLLALENGFFDIAKLLLKKGAEIDVRDERGWTPLIYASYKGLSSVVDFLLLHGSSVNICNDDGWNAIVGALACGHSDIVDKLSKAGARYGDKYVQAALLKSYLSGNLDFVKKLVRVVNNPNIYLKDGSSLVCQCAKNGDDEIVKLLVDVGANPNSVDANKVPLLSFFCNRGNIEMVKYLVERGASINFGTGSKLPIFYAIKQNFFDITVYLVEHGANIASVDDDLNTLLIDAVRRKHFEIAKFLFEHGAGVSDTNKGGYSVFAFLDNRKRSDGVGINVTENKLYYYFKKVRKNSE